MAELLDKGCWEEDYAGRWSDRIHELIESELRFIYFEARDHQAEA
jgi:hypothetical protein